MLAQTRDSVSYSYGFGPGEEIRYKVVYKFAEAWAIAGYATFSIAQKEHQGTPHWVCLVRGTTSKAFDLFYKVEDEYASMLNPKSMLPKYFLRNVNEGGFKIWNTYTFEHDSLRVLSETKDSKNPAQKAYYTIDSFTHDIVSAIYYARTIDWDGVQKGATRSISVFLDNELHHLGLKFIGRQVLNTEFGSFNTIVLQPQLIKGRVFDQTDQMRIYLSDDHRKLPIYIESPLKIGKVAAVLVDYKK